MDKNKSRTDLLAAGRKKLQQFRQKKDGKGSSSRGRSSKKASKSENQEYEDDAKPGSSDPGLLSLLSEEGKTPRINSDEMEVGSSETTHELDVAAPHPSPGPVMADQGDAEVEEPVSYKAELKSGELGEFEHDTENLNVGGNPETVSAGAVDTITSPSSLSPDFELEVKHADTSMDTIELGPPPSVSAMDGTETELKQESEEGKSLLPSQEAIPDISSIQARGNQVTDEADGSSTEKSTEILEEPGVDKAANEKYQTNDADTPASPSASISFDGLLTSSALPEADGTPMTSSSEKPTESLEETGVDKAANEKHQTDDVETPASPSASTGLDGLSTSSALPEADVMNPELRVECKQDIAADSTSEEISQVPLETGDTESNIIGVAADAENLTTADRHSNNLLAFDHSSPKELDRGDRLISPEEVITSSSLESGSISLSRLEDIVRRLSEEDYNCLLKSRESGSIGDLGTSALVEKMEEDLYISNFVKDIFQVVLIEMSDVRREFDDEHHLSVSTLRDSLCKVQERNELLEKELTDCRSKLQTCNFSREELECQLDAAKAQVEEFFAKAHDLQLNLERSEGNVTSLSKELSETKARASSLQLENETLTGAIASANDEKRRLVEENESSGDQIAKLLADVAKHNDLVIALQVEKDKLNEHISSLADERMKFGEGKEILLYENEKLLSELADCKNLVVIQQVENSNLSEIFALVVEEKSKLEQENESLTQENENVSLRLDDSNSLVAALQTQIKNLSESLSSVSISSKMLEEENAYFVRENERLLSELVVLQEQLSTEHTERRRLAAGMEELMINFETLGKDNACLSSSLNVYKAKFGDIDNSGTQMQSANQVEIVGVQASGQEEEQPCQFLESRNIDVLSPEFRKPDSGGLPKGPSFALQEEEVFDDSFGFVVLQEHLKEGQKLVHDLEKTIEQIESYTYSLNRLSDKAVAPGVSKLIQAFESKVHSDDNELEDKAVSENQSAADPLASIKEQTKNFEGVLKQLVLDAGSASVLFKGVRDSDRAANVTLKELKVQFDALKEHSEALEATSIEFGILYEAVKQHSFIMEAKYCELEVLCETLQQQENRLRAENIEVGNLYEAVKQHSSGVETQNSELQALCETLKQQENRLRAENTERGERIEVYISRISELHSQLESLQQSSEKTTSTMHEQLECLQEESERVLMLEQERMPSLSQILETVGRLDDLSLRLSPSRISAGTPDGMDFNNHIHFSIDAAIRVMEDLQEKLEAANMEHHDLSTSYKELNEKYNCLFEKNESTTDVLHKVYDDLKKLASYSPASKEVPNMDMQNEELLDPFNLDSYKKLMEPLQNFLLERSQLYSVNERLNSELVSRTVGLEEMNRQSLGHSAIMKLIKIVEGVIKYEHLETNVDEFPGLYLESLVSLLVDKYIQIGEKLTLCKEEAESKDIASPETQGTILQNENDIFILRNSLSQAEESLNVARSELLAKTRELEQSDHRYSSTREKLGMAVAKGKGLIVQRDNLKQSLAEKSSELERCSEEVKLKNARLQEVEAKLKTYAETGERVEALESELSYIRNSATALRESFLLKDSLLQRVEEIFEDLDVPEHFHSRDIIEKVEWLAKSATGSSLPLTDWEQKGSIGGSHSDAGFVVSDSWREDVLPSPNSGDDMRRKFDELQGKFYGLAEQNEMLEQSLMERSNLVQRWEELLDSINIPAQLRGMEPEDKIEWLGSALSEAIHDRDSFQVEIDNLQSYCRSLAADLEASQKKIGEADAELQSVIRDRDSFQVEIDNLQSYCRSLAADLEASQKKIGEADAELQSVIRDRDSFQVEIDNLQSYCRSLAADLEASQKKIGEADAELQSVICDRDSFQREMDSVQSCCRSLAADLEVSRKQTADVDTERQSVVREREQLSKKLESLVSHHVNLSTRMLDFEHENETLESEISSLQEKLVEKVGNEERLQNIEGEVLRLRDLVADSLLDANLEDFFSAGSSIESLEGLLRKLIEYYKSLVSVKPVSEHVPNQQHMETPPENPDDLRGRNLLFSEEPEVNKQQTGETVDGFDEATNTDISITEETGSLSLKQDLEEALLELRLMKEERDTYMEKQQSLIANIESLDKKREELQERLKQEEQKSTSIREKLNVAVRKGKSIVQQRDSLKQTIEGMTTEVARMNSECNDQKTILASYEQKIMELSPYHERVEVLESECNVLRNHLEETEHLLQERGHTWTVMLNTLADIDIGNEGSARDPFEKLQHIGNSFRDMQAAVAASEHESRKSRRAADLLVAELNEVQERNDCLQEELSKSADDFEQMSRLKDEAVAAKLEFLSQLEKLTMVYTEERGKQCSELQLLRASVHQLRAAVFDISNILADVFSKESESLHSLEASMGSYTEQNVSATLVRPFSSASVNSTSSNILNKDNFMSVDSWSDLSFDNSNDLNIAETVGSFRQNLDEFLIEIRTLREKVKSHRLSFHDQVNSVSEVAGIVQREMCAQKESFEAMKRELIQIESIRKEKDTELVMLRENIKLLYDTCADTTVVIESKNAELMGNNPTTFSQAALSGTGNLSSREDWISSSESIKSVVDRLSLAMKEYGTLNANMVEGNLKEMKSTIANLQKELQEKDIQNDRICSELVGQIKEAKAAASSYIIDLESSKGQMHNLERHLGVVQEERNLLEHKVKELQDGQASLTELQKKIGSLTDLLAAKELEIESLMQALDEEEVQMEEAKNRIKELETVVEQKTLDLESLEASRGKVAKKLSVTVSKFDELHLFSETLLAEVEKLQLQLQDRDSEISFLRQEVTRSTNEVLMASQMGNKKDTDAILELFTWFDSMASHVGLNIKNPDDEISQVLDYKNILQKKIMSIVSELQELQVLAQSKEALLDAQKVKEEELRRRYETLEKLSHEKESRLNMLEGDVDLGGESEIVEVEPLINKWTTTPRASISSQVRSLRKTNNDQVAIAIDAESGENSHSLEEDDDKSHGFKSLSTSRIVPRFTRPVTDLVDGLWVSCDRALMRQPALRLGIVLYWAILHALLAAFAV